MVTHELDWSLVCNCTMLRCGATISTEDYELPSDLLCALSYACCSRPEIVGMHQHSRARRVVHAGGQESKQIHSEFGTRCR